LALSLPVDAVIPQLVSQAHFRAEAWSARYGTHRDDPPRAALQSRSWWFSSALKQRDASATSFGSMLAKS